jgi:hypothetical protein
MHRRMDGDLKIRFQALKRVGPPIKNQGSSRVDSLQAVGYYKIMKAEIYNYEGRLVANNEETILELLEINGYIIDPDEEDMKKLRIEHGVDDE